MDRKLAKRTYVGDRWDWTVALGGRTICVGCLLEETSGLYCFACGLFLHCWNYNTHCCGWCADEQLYGP